MHFLEQSTTMTFSENNHSESVRGVTPGGAI